jgi:hypothetical protein
MMSRWIEMWKKVRQEWGQSLVELVIIMPVMLLLFSAIFDVGRSMQAYVVLLNASREAAMVGAAANLDTSTLRTLIFDELERGGLDSGQATIIIEYQQRGFPAEDHIIVRIDYVLPLIMSVLSNNSMNLSSTTEMVVFW